VGIKKGSIMKNWKDNEKSSDTIFDNISISITGPIKIAEKNKETDLNVFTVFSPVIMRRISKTNITMAT
jgi:hypothetical protein